MGLRLHRCTHVDCYRQVSHSAVRHGDLLLHGARRPDDGTPIIIADNSYVPAGKPSIKKCPRSSGIVGRKPGKFSPGFPSLIRSRAPSGSEPFSTLTMPRMVAV